MVEKEAPKSCPSLPGMLFEKNLKKKKKDCAPCLQLPLERPGRRED
jgi:hypothetical protein